MRARVVVDAQARRARETVRGRRERTASLGTARDVVEPARDRFVRTERGGRAVPRAPFDVTRTFERGRERGVHLALLVR